MECYGIIYYITYWKWLYTLSNLKHLPNSFHEFQNNVRLSQIWINNVNGRLVFHASVELARTSCWLEASSFHKGWKIVCKYLRKEVKNWTTWEVRSCLALFVVHMCGSIHPRWHDKWDMSHTSSSLIPFLHILALITISLIS